jgi:hypothetical protein
VPVGIVGFDLDLVPQMLWHALPRPGTNAVQTGLGERHHTSVPLGERRRDRGGWHADGRADSLRTGPTPRASNPQRLLANPDDARY